MPVTQILLLRHGHRMGWSLDPTTGEYSSAHAFPTRLPADPPLAAHGVRQSHETSDHLTRHLYPLAVQDRVRVYSSLFYRCLETLRPTIESLNLHLSSSQPAAKIRVRGERGFSEWFGKAWFDQPVPGPSRLLRENFFPWLDDTYSSLVIPDLKGEKIDEIHERVAKAFRVVVEDVDREYEGLGKGEEEVTLLVCGHAAQIICAGRALTGNVPEDLDTEDFRCFTCGISRFVRRRRRRGESQGGGEREGRGDRGEEREWRNGRGVAGGWDCVENSSCGHLSQGEERGWHFHGDESFDSYGPGSGPKGIVVEEGTVSEEDEDESKSSSGGAGGGSTSKL